MTIPDGELEANCIEIQAGDIACECGLETGDWEAFLTNNQIKRLIELADQGYGTWGQEPDTLARMKSLDDLKR